MRVPQFADFLMQKIDDIDDDFLEYMTKNQLKTYASCSTFEKERLRAEIYIQSLKDIICKYESYIEDLDECIKL